MRPSLFIHALLAALASVTTASSALAQTVLKWAHVYETSEPFHTESVWAAQEIERRTQGRWHIDVYPASQLGSDTSLNQGLTLGTVDIILAGSSFAARSFPRIGVTYYPYVFRSPAHFLAYAQSDIYHELTRGYEAQSGHSVIATTYYGTRHTSSNRPFDTCAEMKGLKIRVPDVAIYSAMPRACAANPAPITFAETYLALQNGTVDAQENPLTTIDAKKFYEVQKHIILTGHIVDHVNTVIAKHLWQQISEADRHIFTEVARAAAERTTAQVIAREKTLIDTFRARGLTVSEIDTETFRRSVLTHIPLAPFGFEQSDWERIQAVKER